MTSSDHHKEAIQGLIQTGKYFFDRGWSLGTSSNYSVVLTHTPLTLLITGSGKDKGRLTDNDFVTINEHGQTIAPPGAKSSAETFLHIAGARAPLQTAGLAYTGTTQAPVGAILHTHSVWGAVLSDHFFETGYVPIQGFEMAKGLAGISTHTDLYKIPIFDNTQDIPKLASQVASRYSDPNIPVRHGYLIRGHGLYTWGKNLEEARRHVEIFEYLLEVTGRVLSLKGRLS
jgi:methylthioribulose-1-phosphate dehydratase